MFIMKRISDQECRGR